MNKNRNLNHDWQTLQTEILEKNPQLYPDLKEIAEQHGFKKISEFLKAIGL